jgi:hypothetical protein
MSERSRAAGLAALAVCVLAGCSSSGSRPATDPATVESAASSSPTKDSSVTTPPAPSDGDPLVARLAADAYGDPWNYAVREQVIDAIWAEADGTPRLVAIATDESAPLKSRFLACEVLFERELTGIYDVGDTRVAGIYARALAENLTGRANSWGLLYQHDDEGPVGVRFRMLGKASVAALRPLLDDERETLVYEGSEEATVGNAYHFRIKDFAAFYLSKLARLPLAYHAKPADRDRAIAELAARL